MRWKWNYVNLSFSQEKPVKIPSKLRKTGKSCEYNALFTDEPVKKPVKSVYNFLKGYSLFPIMVNYAPK